MLVILIVGLLLQLSWLLPLTWLSETFREIILGSFGIRPLIPRSAEWWDIYGMNAFDPSSWSSECMVLANHGLESTVNQYSDYPRTDHCRRQALFVQAMDALEQENLRRAFVAWAYAKNQAKRKRSASPSSSGSTSGWRQVLGVGKNDDWATIKQAYRRLARQHAPDLGGSHDNMVAVNVAFAQAREETGNV